MRTSWTLSAIAAAAFALGIAGGFTFAKQGKLEYTMVPAGTSKLAPLDPKQPNGAQRAVLSGDPKTGRPTRSNSQKSAAAIATTVSWIVTDHRI